ncbi:MAG: hypothetical protein L7F77_11695 [Candidatus Magnetominusculus sp. LBB02]|nr:hypothetical protein [Candidatus Magnetominusculus sp. LBB02]
MYYIAWLIIIMIVAVWKRELRMTKSAYIAVLGELKSERMEFDKLMEKYAHLLTDQGVAAAADASDKRPNRRKSKVNSSN